MALWSVLLEGDQVVLWRQEFGKVPVKCGNGPSEVIDDLAHWVVTSAEPFDIVRVVGRPDCVRLAGPAAVHGRALVS